MNYQRIGGLAAFAQAVVYACFLTLVLGVLPAFGSYELSDYTNATQILRKAALHPTVQPFLLGYDLLNIAFGLLPLLIMVSLVQLISKATAMERYLMVGLVLVNTTLWLAAAAIDSAGLPTYLQLYAQHPDEALAGYQVVGIVSLQLGNAGAFAYGLALLVMWWAARRTNVFSRAFLLLSFLWGGCAVLSWPFVIAGALSTIIGVIWCVWLGWVVFRTPKEHTQQKLASV